MYGNLNFQINQQEQVWGTDKYEIAHIQDPLNNFFFENALKKKYWIFFQIYFFYLKVESFQIAASAGHAVTYTIGPIFKHIIDCV